AGVRDIGVVVGYFGDLIKEALGDGSSLNVRFTYIVQGRRLGIAHAIHLAIEQRFIDKPFVVYLGDNILSHGIGKHLKRFVESGSDVYILLSRVKDPSRFGVAVIRDGRVVKLVEKPKEFVSDLAVVGVYFFRDPDLVEKAFKTLKPSWRGEYEITELIQWFIDNGYRVDYDIVSGWWKDVGTYEGLLEALYLLLDDVVERVEGEVRGEVVGRVVVESGAVVEGKVYGPAYIGRNTYIGRNAVVEHFVSVEQGSKISSGSLTRSLVLDNAVIDVDGLRLVDSVVGSNTVIKSSRELRGEARIVVSDYSQVYL
ncbi:MAG: glucose-1-phosphate thymidylyltransferase, partial [Desulfurococcaceae archaeon]|nr:glucose-1-phosphate thymidylyltransferase [Desulfurococcaceae archaeon]